MDTRSSSGAGKEERRDVAGRMAEDWGWGWLEADMSPACWTCGWLLVRAP
jgi:hypothetical protein